MDNLKNKVVIITGSSMGIGKAVAHEFLERGCRVVLNGRNADRLSSTVEQFVQMGFTVESFVGDVSDENDCEQLVQHAVQSFGQLDIVINNAGVSMEGSLNDLSPDVVRQVMNVNFLGSVFVTQAAIPYLKRSQGSIVFVSSGAGLHGLPNYSAYCASKMALTALAESLEIELAEFDVHIGLIMPGFTENDQQKKILNSKGHWIAQPDRSGVRQMPTHQVARHIVGMCERRTSRLVLTAFGKLAWLINRISPRLARYVLQRRFRRRKNLVGNQRTVPKLDSSDAHWAR